MPSKEMAFVLGWCLALPGLAIETGSSRTLILAELIVGPESSQVRPSQGASRQRAKASTYQDERPFVVDDDIGILQPRGGAPSEERAFENRNRARANQHSGEGNGPMLAPGMPILDPNSTARSVEQRNKARAYTGTGNTQDIDLSNVGRDGIPLVQCHNVDNVSGRIGDDTISGSIVFLVRNGQQIKVRCQ